MELARGTTNIPDMLRPRRKLRSRGDALSVCLVAVRDKRCEASFERLYEYYAPRICAFLHQKGADQRISQEIMQEAMTQVWLRADTFDDKKASASTWIFTVARNRFIDVVRKSKRSEIDINDPLLVRGETPAPDARIDRTERTDRLNDAISALPPDQSEVLQLVYMNGMKQQDVADRLSIPLNTVKSRLRLALEKLRKNMEPV
ncbi:MAG: sigma-70 family RNA polymerase sigma factor [Pseudomonadota bacterium]